MGAGHQLNQGICYGFQNGAYWIKWGWQRCITTELFFFSAYVLFFLSHFKGGWDNNPMAGQFQTIYQPYNCSEWRWTNWIRQRERTVQGCVPVRPAPGGEEPDDFPYPSAYIPAIMRDHSYLPTRWLVISGGVVVWKMLILCNVKFVVAICLKSIFWRKNVSNPHWWLVQ